MELFGKLGRAAKKSHGLVDGHLEDIVNGLATIVNGEHIRLEPLSIAGLTGGIDILKKVHLKLLHAASFTPIASATSGIKGELPCSEALPERFPAEVLAQDGPLYTLRLRDTRALENVLLSLREAGIGIVELELQPPDLEEVFLRLMARHG